MIGYLWALASVVLVSAAQLMMRYTMMHCSDGTQLISALLSAAPWVWWLPGGILCYGLSMLCWLFALRDLPLNRAYPLLSLSYVLVCALAVSLPLFGERLNGGKLLGMGLIILGLLVITPPGAVRGNRDSGGCPVNLPATE
ncbi:4-amino-4-deoxy-L-arabinose-phosphoundecaprenol flippase subunit ArnF [Edwardsiella ictaluri]|uniref:4-amino-4-deoxy-L-arabinose-phosphoundecaprenol flippase subunit ArnF n=1 Tax=Edwardsiella ictaluri TaxID=67780 RepID=UPI003A598BA4